MKWLVSEKYGILKVIDSRLKAIYPLVVDTMFDTQGSFYEVRRHMSGPLVAFRVKEEEKIFS